MRDSPTSDTNGSGAGTIRTPTEDDIPQLLELRRTSFGSSQTTADAAAVGKQRARLPHLRGVDVGGRLVAAMAWYPFGAFIGGERREVGALAGVVSLPEERRRGHVARLLRDGLERLHERGVGWALEHPFDPRFYARSGFQSVANGHRLRLPTSALARGRGPAVERVAFGDADGLARIREVHARFAAARTFALARDAEVGGTDPWDDLFETPGSDGPVVAYLLADGSAYAIVELGGFGEKGTLEVHDLAWTNGRGRAGLLRFLGTFAGQLHHTALHLPADDPLALDWSAWQHASRPVLQARVASLAAALEPLRLPPGSAPRSVVLELRDETCPWNAGWWRLELTPEGTRAAATADAPQLATDPAGLVRLLTGSSPAALVADGAAEGEPAAAASLALLAVERRPFLCRGDFF